MENIKNYITVDAEHCETPAEFEQILSHMRDLNILQLMLSIVKHWQSLNKYSRTCEMENVQLKEEEQWRILNDLKKPKVSLQTKNSSYQTKN